MEEWCLLHLPVACMNSNHMWGRTPLMSSGFEVVPRNACGLVQLNHSGVTLCQLTSHGCLQCYRLFIQI